MTNSDTQEKIHSQNFSRTFEKMCNFLAVSKTGDPKATIKGLLSLCLLDFQAEDLKDAADFKTTIETLFGISIPLTQIEEGLDALESDGHVVRLAQNSYKLDTVILEEIRQKIEESRTLERDIKSSWFKEIEDSGVELNLDTAWTALQSYLARSFRRHGIQTAALIDSSIEIPNEIEVSLSVMLNEAIDEHVAKEQHKTAHRTISGFLAQVGTDQKRASYIAHLADGAFNFYTLEVPSDLAESFRDRLHELTILLDTNFLFGIMDLHYNQHVQVSHDLLRVIKDHKLPFKLRYHEATAREMEYTIHIQGEALRSKVWTRHLSKAASESRNLSGLEQKFHERNAQGQLDVDEFLRPFDHFDQILKGHNIEIYRPNQVREQNRIDLHHEYKDYLRTLGAGDKAYETIMHDATVLEETRHIRSKSDSSLEAGALFITCDYKLYCFDWNKSNRNGHKACVLLPNLFWQILRPFIPADPIFEKSFAETFALPEFRALSSGGSKACSKMLGILASYKGMPEETVFSMLSNDLLIENLKIIQDNDNFIEQVEVAIVEENNILLEEATALKEQLKKQKHVLENQEKELQNENENHTKQQDKLESSLDLTESKLAKTKSELQELRRNIDEAEKAANLKIEEAQKGLATLGISTGKAQKRDFVMSIIAGLAMGALLIVGLLFYTFLAPWTWLIDHDKILPISIGIAVGLVCLSLGGTVPNWRRACWGSGALAIFVTLLQLI